MQICGLREDSYLKQLESLGISYPKKISVGNSQVTEMGALDLYLKLIKTENQNNQMM